VGDAGIPNLDAGWASRGVTAEDGLQNDQESLVLYTGWDGSTGTVIDAVGWGTATSFHGEGSPAPEIEFESWDNSIGRYPDGTDTGNNAADFVQSWWDTPGEANTQGQPAGWVRLTGSTQGNDTYPMDIPDDDVTGVTLTITSPSFLPATISDIHVGVKIRHTYIGDLHVDFTSPAATTVTLHNNTGSSTDNIFTVYDLVTAPDVGTMGSFDGQSTSPGTGTWSLNAYDNDAIFYGTVEEWIIWLAP
jgi:subtilisin-like proprotein convertase family protein